jgi:hypothetical protein
MMSKAYRIVYNTYKEGALGCYDNKYESWVISDRLTADHIKQVIGSVDTNSLQVDEIDVVIDGDQYRELLPPKKFDPLPPWITNKLKKADEEESRTIWEKMSTGKIPSPQELKFFKTYNKLNV